MRQSVVDPQSLFDTGISQPVKGFDGLVWGEWTWVCVRANGRNRMGGLTGPQVIAFGFQGSRTRVVENHPDLCSKAVYGPFPELDDAIKKPIQF
jgi:hypothetical protein